MMGEVALVAGDADNGLQERLDKEISAFNAAATGYAKPRQLCIAVRDDSGDLLAGERRHRSSRQAKPREPAPGGMRV